MSFLFANSDSGLRTALLEVGNVSGMCDVEGLLGEMDWPEKVKFQRWELST
jgi:hypothetical protein